ncbi:MAG TPA: polysaccharide pyruvyl transferase family protein [Gammaproteobacteria bacterium]|nr:polysaccharide pyruvyl transferase family protein [Gammaproteobacteria bacterium]
MQKTQTSQPKCKRILFIGAYGIENAGDDLPMLAMIENLQRFSPRTHFEFHTLTRHVNQWETQHYPVIFHQNLEYESREQAQGKWIRGLNPDDDRHIFTEFTQLIKSMDMLIIGAGNFIIDMCIDIFRGPIPLNWWHIHIAKLYDKKVFLYGFSTTPLISEYGKLLTKEIINRSDIVTVRDNDSRQYLRTLNIQKRITVLPDPTLSTKTDLSDFTFLHRTDLSLRKRHNTLTIALGLRTLPFLPGQEEKVFSTLCNFIKKNPQYRYVFVPQSTYCADDDIALSKKIADQTDHNIKVHVIERRYTPQQLISIYSLADYTIAIRLHSAVFSQIAGTPAIAINYLPKVASYMKDFGTITQCIDLDKLSPTELKQTLVTMEKNTHLPAFIRQQHAKKRRQAGQYAKMALALLEQKD